MDAPATSNRLRIYLVENDADTRQLLVALLGSFGHEVHCGRSVAEATSYLVAHRCDVLISDIGLPDGSGWELMDVLRANANGTLPYAIAMSGFGRSADIERSRSAGFRHHLVKPMDIDKVDGLLRDAERELGPHRGKD